MGLQEVDAEAAALDQRREKVERLVVPELGLMYRVALRLTRNPTNAEDLVQETLLRAVKAIDTFDGRYPRAWLLTILRNTNINRARQARPEVLTDLASADGSVEPVADPREAPENIVVDEAFDGKVADAFHALPEKFRSVVEAVDVDGLTYAEASSLLTIPAGTVMSRLHRGRLRMRKTLSADGFGSRGKST